MFLFFNPSLTTNLVLKIPAFPNKEYKYWYFHDYKMLYSPVYMLDVTSKKNMVMHVIFFI